MFHLVCLGWLFFRSASLTQAGHMLKLMATAFEWNVQATNILVALVLFCLPLWLVQSLQVKSGRLAAPVELSLLPRVALYAVLILMFVTLGNTGGGAFIYFQF